SASAAEAALALASSREAIVRNRIERAAGSFPPCPDQESLDLCRTVRTAGGHSGLTATGPTAATESRLSIRLTVKSASPHYAINCRRDGGDIRAAPPVIYAISRPQLIEAVRDPAVQRGLAQPSRRPL